MAPFPLTCFFCHRATYFDYRDVLTEDDYYKCTHCPHDVTCCKPSPDVWIVSMKVAIRDKFYSVDLWGPTYECSISEVTETNTWLGDILSLKYVPEDWNPTNIEAKVKQVLTFL